MSPIPCHGTPHSTHPRKGCTDQERPGPASVGDEPPAPAPFFPGHRVRTRALRGVPRSQRTPPLSCARLPPGGPSRKAAGGLKGPEGRAPEYALERARRASRSGRGTAAPGSADGAGEQLRGWRAGADHGTRPSAAGHRLPAPEPRVSVLSLLQKALSDVRGFHGLLQAAAAG